MYDLAYGRNGVHIFDRGTGTLLRTIPYMWPDAQYSLRERVAVLGARTIVGETLMAYCGGVTGCGPCETCGPSGSCVAAPHPTCQQMTPSGDFRLMFLNTDGGDLAQWKGSGQFAPGGPPDTGPAFFLFGAPNIDTDYALCVYDASSALLFRAEAPADDTCAGAPCWRMRGSPFGPRGTYSYRDRDRTPDGVRSVRLFRRTDTGLATINVRGSGPNLSNHPQGLPSLPLTLPLRVQLQSRDGQCFETTHSTATINSAERFVSPSD